MKSCLECQACCRYLTIPINKQDINYLQFYKNWGLDYVELRDCYLFFVESPCKHLTKYGCDSYHNRPTVCRKQEPDPKDVICIKGEIRWRDDQINCL